MGKPRHYILIALMMSLLYCKAQYPVNQYYRIKQLLPVDTKDSLKEGYSIIYGSFTHRSRMSTVRERYDEVRLQDTTSGETYAFAVSPDKYFDKYYLMAFHIKPGVYFLTEYFYADRRLIPQKDNTSYEKAYYGQFTKGKKEPILRSSSSKNIIPAIQFILVVKENSINFIGNWNFNDMDPPFKDKKEKLDEIMVQHYKKLDFTKAYTSLPY